MKNFVFFSLTGAKNIGINPKINNILQCYDSLKYDYVWICDSNIKGLYTYTSYFQRATYRDTDKLSSKVLI